MLDLDPPLFEPLQFAPASSSFGLRMIGGGGGGKGGKRGGEERRETMMLI